MSIQMLQLSLFRPEGRMRSVRNLGCVAVLIFSVISVGVSQQSVQGAAVQQPAAPENAVVSPDNAKPLSTQSPQQKQLAEDTATLLTLANQLKAEMDKSSKDTLSLSVVKKAE